MKLIPASILILAAGLTSACFAQQETTKVLLIGKDRDHPPKTHEYMADCELLAKCLRQSPAVEAIVSNGWPTDPKILEGLDTIVLVTAKGGNVLFSEPARREQVESLLRKGVGLVAIHWSTDADEGIAGEKQMEYLGGWFSPKFSEIPFEDSRVRQADPNHPISQGWSEFPMHDEYYIKLRFKPEIKPIMKATVKGEDYVVGWTYERGDGGRSFGTVCGHFHENMAKPDLRRALVNAILWTAKQELPPQGAPCDVSESDLVLPPDPRAVAK